jgi:thiamine-phosphate pyrophosphorylase
MTAVAKFFSRKSVDLSLYLIMNSPSFSCEKRLIDIVVEAVKGGVTAVQLRDFESSNNSIVELTGKLQPLIAPVPLFINTHNVIDVAKQVDAAGVFLEKEQDYESVRKALGDHAIIGTSAINTEQVQVLNQSDAIDYISVKITESKITNPDSEDTLWGYEGISQVCSSVDHPIVGIGGVGLSNVESVYRRLRLGDGVAVAGAITRSHDPRRAAQTIQKIKERVCEEKR